MRYLLALGLLVSFSVHAQRVKENIRQHRVINSENQVEVKKPVKKVVPAPKKAEPVRVRKR